MANIYLQCPQLAEWLSLRQLLNFYCHLQQAFLLDYKNRKAFLKAFFDADQLYEIKFYSLLFQF
jgi:hypothetical protein